MTDGSLVAENFKIVTAFKRLIPKEVNFIKIRFCKELETIGLVPSTWKDIKRNLTPNAKGQIQIGKFLSHGLHHICSDIVGEIKNFVVIALLARTVAANGRDIHHSTSKLNECSTLMREKKSDECFSIKAQCEMDPKLLLIVLLLLLLH